MMMTIKGGSNKACAACKYQRRRCSKECSLAPYFPSDQPKKFSNAHRLFGVANIKKILDQVEPRLRDEAMKSIIFESNMREQFPVMGCLGLICNYNNQVLTAMEELRYVNLKLSVYREQYHYQISQKNSPSMSMEFMPVSIDPFSMSNHEVVRSTNHLQHDNNEVIVFDGGGGGNERFGFQQSINPMTAQSSNFIVNHQPEMDTVECDDFNPYNEMFDDKPLLMEYKEQPCESRCVC